MNKNKKEKISNLTKEDKTVLDSNELVGNKENIEPLEGTPLIDSENKGINKDKRISYQEPQHKRLLAYIGAEDKNFMLVVSIVSGLGGMLFWQLIQLLNLFEVSQTISNLEEPLTYALMIALVALYFIQKKSLKDSVFAPIIENRYYVHQVEVLKKELVNDRNGYTPTLKLNEYDKKIEVLKNIYDKIKTGETVDVVYSIDTNEIVYIVPTIN